MNDWFNELQQAHCSNVFLEFIFSVTSPYPLSLKAEAPLIPLWEGIKCNSIVVMIDRFINIPEILILYDINYPVINKKGFKKNRQGNNGPS